MNHMKRILGIGIALCLQIIIVLTCVEKMTFHLPYYEDQYFKNKVFDAVEMEPKELLFVTQEMLLYLQDKRETLDMKAQVNDVEKEFFNEKEKQHMKDVKNLFLVGYQIRRFSSILLVFSLLLLLLWQVPKWNDLLLKSIQWVTGSLLISIFVISLIIMMDFSRSFTIFHQIFFTNDLWLLDYETDWLIRMVPEPFFYDISVKIGTWILFILGLQWILTTFYFRKITRRRS